LVTLVFPWSPLNAELHYYWQWRSDADTAGQQGDNAGLYGPPGAKFQLCRTVDGDGKEEMARSCSKSGARINCSASMYCN
jgi:hypothetical protein